MERADGVAISDSVQGALRVSVAFDWGDEIDLVHAATLVPTESPELPRRRRTPNSIGYRPAPLRYRMNSVVVGLGDLGDFAADVEVTVFDFAAVSVSFQFPLSLTTSQLSQLAASLAHPDAMVLAAQRAAEPLFERLRPAIKDPNWGTLSEEYFTFVLQPQGPLGQPSRLVEESPDWLARIVRLESESLSAEEVSEALRLRMAYGQNDLTVVEWSAAVVIDRDCEETLQMIDFANVQLLELRELDRRVDDALAAAYGLIHRLAGSRLPFWRLQARPMRVLGDIRMEADMLLERTGSAFKLVGDPYLARLYRQVATRLHLDEWARSVHASLDSAQGVHEILGQQSSTYRIELLEVVVIVLIAFEIGLALWGKH